MRVRAEEQRNAFRTLGFDLKGTFDSFEIAEDDPRWEQVSALIKQFKVFDTATTKYSDRELRTADVVGVLCSSPRGYPEPSGDFGYLLRTFDLTEYCDLCGIGGRQVAPFRLKKVPKLRNSVLQLNWVFDELFVDRSVWRRIFEPFGIGSRPTVHHGTGVELDDLVQLDIHRTVDVNVDQLKKFKDCRRCGRRKYWPKYLLCSYPPPRPTDAAIFRSKQYFGDGLLAFNLVFVSQPLFLAIKQTGLRSVSFHLIG